jgi:DNA-binding LytR/AlgR family response regulator
MSNKIRAVIIDDMDDSRAVIAVLLKDYPDMEVCGMAANADNGIKLILDTLPHVVFLDVEMPGKNGLELLDELKKSGYTPHIIFTTGYHDYAIQAVRQRAFDYLVKPIDADELQQSITRLRIALQKNNTDHEVMLYGKTSLSPARIRFNTRTGFVLINPDEIVYCKAALNYTEIYLHEKEMELVTVQIGRISPLLEGTSLKRVGKSYIINTIHIKEVDRKDERITFRKGGKEFNLLLSLTYLKQLEEQMV